jgi:hypothetical protein
MSMQDITSTDRKERICTLLKYVARRDCSD